MKNTRKASLITLLLTCVFIVGCQTTQKVSYQHDVRPILVAKCQDCHTPPYGEGYRATGLDMKSYENLLKGSVYGAVIIPGDSTRSPLNMLVEGRAGNLSRRLEELHKPVTTEEIKILHLWVEQGAQNN